MKLNESPLYAAWIDALRKAGYLPPVKEGSLPRAEDLCLRPSQETYDLRPPWSAQGRAELSSASGGRRLEKTLDFSPWNIGQFKFTLELLQAQDGRSYLQLGWEATEPNPGGWWLAFYAQEEIEQAILELPLGSGMKGQEMLFTSQLGFDPFEIPFRVMVFPKEDGGG